MLSKAIRDVLTLIGIQQQPAETNPLIVVEKFVRGLMHRNLHLVLNKHDDVILAEYVPVVLRYTSTSFFISDHEKEIRLIGIENTTSFPCRIWLWEDVRKEWLCTSSVDDEHELLGWLERIKSEYSRQLDDAHSSASSLDYFPPL